MANGIGTLDMSTRNVSDVPRRLDRCTEFQLYVGRGADRNVLDFTLHKLVAYALKQKDAQLKLTLMALIEDYRAGLVAVAWRRGAPVPLRVTKDA